MTRRPFVDFEIIRGLDNAVEQSGRTLRRREKSRSRCVSMRNIFRQRLFQPRVVATENNAARSLSGRITRRKNLTAASFSNSRAMRTLDELSKSIASRIGDSLRVRSPISAGLPSIFSSKSDELQTSPTARPLVVEYRNRNRHKGRIDLDNVVRSSFGLAWATAVGDAVLTVVGTSNDRRPRDRLRRRRRARFHAARLRERRNRETRETRTKIEIE